MQSPATRCRPGAASRGDVQSKCQGVLAVRWDCPAAARHIDTPVFWGGYGCLEGAGCRAAIVADALELETGSGSGPVDEGLEVQRAVVVVHVPFEVIGLLHCAARVDCVAAEAFWAEECFRLGGEVEGYVGQGHARGGVAGGAAVVLVVAPEIGARAGHQQVAVAGRRVDGEVAAAPAVETAELVAVGVAQDHVIHGSDAEIDGYGALAVAQKVDIAAIAVEEEIASEGSPALGHGRDDTELPRGGQGVLATARPCKRMGVSYNSERNPGAFTASNVV